MSTDPATEHMAAQMAQLLTQSDLPELEEIVARWIKDAATETERSICQRFGTQLVALKKQFTALGAEQPTKQELELALTMMLQLAAQKDRA